MGYNGTPPGTSNVCEEVLPDGSLKTLPTVEHAERNLIYFAARRGIPLEGTSLYITHAPCMECSRAILAAGVKDVTYTHPYGDGSGAEFLRAAGISCTTP